ncbi:MAG: leucine-rich repeat protein [Clostridia bacterium]
MKKIGFITILISMLVFVFILTGCLEKTKNPEETETKEYVDLENTSFFVTRNISYEEVEIIGIKLDVALESTINIPSTIEGKTVVGIADNAFENCLSITTINLNDAAIETIGDYAFLDCVNLVNVILSESLLDLGECAFKNCSSLKNISIPTNLRNIEENAFVNCDNIFIQVSSENSCYSSNKGILFNKDKTKLIKFSGNSITEYNVPIMVEEISNFAFANKSNLITINLNNVGTIGQGAFYNSGITTILGGDSLNRAGILAFDGTTWMNNNSGDNNGMVTLGKVLIKYKGISNNIASTMFPLGITTIGEGAFINTDIIEISISENIDCIQSSAFYACNNLQSVTIRRLYPPVLGENVFQGYLNGKIYVPATNIEFYQNSIFMSEYKNIISTKQFNINFQSNGGTAIEECAETFYSNIENIQESSKPYYDFEGWYDNTEFTGTKLQNGEFWHYDSNITLYANWIPTKYVLSYIYNDGIKVSNPIDFNCESNLAINESNKIGYNFDAWYENSDFTGNAITNTSQFVDTNYGHKTLYAKFNPITYKVNLDKNADNAILSLDMVEVDFGTSFTLPIPEREGYNFEGWQTSEEFRFTTEKGESVKNWDVAEDTTLFARWRVKSYIIT